MVTSVPTNEEVVGLVPESAPEFSGANYSMAFTDWVFLCLNAFNHVPFCVMIGGGPFNLVTTDRGGPLIVFLYENICVVHRNFLH